MELANFKDKVFDALNLGTTEEVRYREASYLDQGYMFEEA